MLTLSSSAVVRTTLSVRLRLDYITHLHEVYLGPAPQRIELTHYIKFSEYTQRAKTSIQDDYPSKLPRLDVYFFEVRPAFPYQSRARTIKPFPKTRRDADTKLLQNLLKDLRRVARSSGVQMLHFEQAASYR